MLRGDGLVKVLDFGLAKVAATPALGTTVAETKVGVLLGTVQYMSPEQARGQPVDARSDVWSLGAMLHELFTGAPPPARSTPANCPWRPGLAPGR